MKNKLILFLLLNIPLCIRAQFALSFSAEGGFAGSTVKTEELPVFFGAYNNYYASSSLQKTFKTDIGMATGKYMHFVVGFGGEKCKSTIGFGRYLLNTPHDEVRFSNGEGRDVWLEIKEATSEVGLKFDLGRFTIGTQFDMVLRTNSIYSQYIFRDGSTSIGDEHVLNGVFSNNRLQVGFGGNLAFRVIKNVALIARFDYIMKTDDKHPGYHQYEDLQNWKDIDYLPRDFNEYFNNPYNMTENSISNDVRGLRFGFGVQFYFATASDE
jgi:hypothetical protein